MMVSKTKGGQSYLEKLVAIQIKEAALPEPVRQHKFWPGRQFAFDFAWPEVNLALEVEGGLGNPRSGHRSYNGIHRDIKKGNEALLLGWRVLRVTTTDVNEKKVVELIRRAMR